MNKKYQRPEPTAADDAHAVTISVMNSLGPVGAAGAELFGWLVEPPLNARKNQWMDDVAEGLRELERRADCVLEELKEKPEFIDAVCQASMAAIRTSQEEKREALRNAVLNSALPHSPDEWERTMFIHYVESLSVWHLIMLRLLCDPLAWFREAGIAPKEYHIAGSLGAMVVQAIPEVQGRSELIEQCISDLQSRGLLAKFSYHTMVSQHGVYENRGTKHGHDFLAYISSPIGQKG